MKKKETPKEIAHRVADNFVKLGKAIKLNSYTYKFK